MMTAIDQVANQNHLQMIKAILPYLPPNNQQSICFCIKMMELQNISAYYRSHTCCVQSLSAASAAHPSEILNDIRNYCDESEQAIVDQLLQTISMIELYTAMAQNPQTPAGFSETFYSSDAYTKKEESTEKESSI